MHRPWRAGVCVQGSIESSVFLAAGGFEQEALRRRIAGKERFDSRPNALAWIASSGLPDHRGSGRFLKFGSSFGTAFSAAGAGRGARLIASRCFNGVASFLPLCVDRLQSHGSETLAESVCWARLPWTLPVCPVEGGTGKESDDCRLSSSLSWPLWVSVCVGERERECVCVCERKREVCVREREREREWECVCVCVRKRVCERECVCVCVRKSVCVWRESVYMCVCRVCCVWCVWEESVCVCASPRVCVCVCVWESARVCVCEASCVCVSESVRVCLCVWERGS